MAKNQPKKEAAPKQKNSVWALKFYLTGYGPIKAGEEVTDEQKKCFEAATVGRPEVKISQFIK